MVNRIEKWWQEVLKWKKRFETLGNFSPNDKWLLKEQLRKYEQIGSAKIKHPTKDEIISKHKLIQEKKDIEKMLFPNRLVRSLRSLGKTFEKISSIVGLSNKNPNVVDLHKPQFKQAFEKMGLTKNEIPKTMDILYNKPSSELLVSNQILDTKVILSDNGKWLDGLQFSLTLEGKETKSIFVENGSSLDKRNAIGLLQGRPVFKKDKWLIPDLNDCDTAGNLKIKEIFIAGYDLVKEIKKIPETNFKADQIEEMVKLLQAGQRVELYSKKHPGIAIEANPLSRSIHLFQNEKRITINDLNENAPAIKMKIYPQMQSERRKNVPKHN